MYLSRVTSLARLTLKPETVRWLAEGGEIQVLEEEVRHRFSGEYIRRTEIFWVDSLAEGGAIELLVLYDIEPKDSFGWAPGDTPRRTVQTILDGLRESPWFESVRTEDLLRPGQFEFSPLEDPANVLEQADDNDVPEFGRGWSDAYAVAFRLAAEDEAIPSPLYMLIGALEGDDNPAVGFLASSGFEIGRLRELLVDARHRARSVGGSISDDPRRTIGRSLATVQRNRIRDGRVHLLLALLQIESNEVRNILGTYGVDVGRLEQALEDALVTAPDLL